MWKESINKKKSTIAKYNPEVNKYCHNCGSIIAKLADICLNCGIMSIKPTVRPLESLAKPQKSFIVTLILLIFLPSFHRFYTGHIASGVLFIITFGGFFLWWFIDLITILSGGFRDKDGNPLV